MKKRIILLTLFITLFITSIFIGVADLKVIDVINFDKKAWEVIYESRFPRTISVVLTAAGLSIAGLILQTLNRNKYISPSTMGATQGARLGILILFITVGRADSFTQFVFGFGTSFIVSLFFLYLIRNVKSKGGVYIPLIGMMYTAILTSLITTIAYYYDMLQVVEAMGIGSFSNIISFNYFYIYLIVPVLVLAVIYSVKFGIVGLGKEFTTNLGVNYQRTLMIGLLIVSVISSVTYVVIGPIPLLGLIVPNIMSLYYGDNLKKNIIDIGLFGATFLLLCDIIARLIVFPFEIPISVITSVFGSIIFLILVLRGKQHAKA